MSLRWRTALLTLLFLLLAGAAIALGRPGAALDLVLGTVVGLAILWLRGPAPRG